MGGMIGAMIGVCASTWLMLVYAKKIAGREAVQREARYILEYSKGPKIAGVLALVFGLLVLIGVFYEALPGRQTAAWTAAALLVPLCLALFLEFWVVQVSFDEQEIHTRSPWRSKRKVPWSDVVSLDYSHLNAWHLVGTRNQGYIRLSILLSGLGTFMPELEKRNIRKPGASPNL